MRIDDHPVFRVAHRRLYDCVYRRGCSRHNRHIAPVYAARAQNAQLRIACADKNGGARR